MCFCFEAFQGLIKLIVTDSKFLQVVFCIFHLNCGKKCEILKNYFVVRYDIVEIEDHIALKKEIMRRLSIIK